MGHSWFRRHAKAPFGLLPAAAPPKPCLKSKPRRWRTTISSAPGSGSSRSFGSCGPPPPASHTYSSLHSCSPSVPRLRCKCGDSIPTKRTLEDLSRWRYLVGRMASRRVEDWRTGHARGKDTIRFLHLKWWRRQDTFGGSRGCQGSCRRRYGNGWTRHPRLYPDPSVVLGVGSSTGEQHRRRLASSTHTLSRTTCKHLPTLPILCRPTFHPCPRQPMLEPEPFLTSR